MHIHVTNIDILRYNHLIPLTFICFTAFPSTLDLNPCGLNNVSLHLGIIYHAYVELERRHESNLVIPTSRLVCENLRIHLNTLSTFSVLCWRYVSGEVINTMAVYYLAPIIASRQQ